MVTLTIMEEKITRRELFRRAARLLPIIALASIPAVQVLAESVTDCNGACKATCNNGCHGTHKGMCSTCSHACMGTCMGGCKGTCGLGCDGACVGSPTGRYDYKPHQKQPINETLANVSVINIRTIQLKANRIWKEN